MQATLLQQSGGGRCGCGSRLCLCQLHLRLCQLAFEGIVPRIFRFPVIAGLHSQKLVPFSLFCAVLKSQQLILEWMVEKWKRGGW
jgi:hypothetical protein